ncbi:DUF2530 domain-containing protein [Ornithinicoccus halotolerans]|uniref:DUF2530 domain-containing protein n=1 Tax=Ornithinicoccus halotolerans TaxID=1748220 RepID=UPI001886341E|nr:DUF2530 domain-containing protein [Ornithinicoccus halotolerans]
MGDGTGTERPADRAAGRPAPREVVPPAVAVSSRAVAAWGTALWAVALAVVLLVPDLRVGARSWWPWVPACGMALGLLGWAYLARGRGNAAEAE